MRRGLICALLTLIPLPDSLLGEDRRGIAPLRASKLFAASRAVYEPGWSTHDVVADPKFVRLGDDSGQESDLRLCHGSPAIDAGQVLPENWPDPLRAEDAGQPDIGAVPLGRDGWRVGIDGRISVFGGNNPSSSEVPSSR